MNVRFRFFTSVDITKNLPFLTIQRVFFERLLCHNKYNEKQSSNFQILLEKGRERGFQKWQRTVSF